MVYSVMMSLLTVCDFFPVIMKTLKPITIQSLVFITAILGYYISGKYDNIKRLRIYLDHLIRKYLFSWHSEAKAENSYQKLIDKTDNNINVI
ncbi:MAG: hypothetical protein LRY69_06605 [Gammaproteobacteria bacterium]|nr:hypothetical protein [Gammaproteobacteria bacterium]